MNDWIPISERLPEAHKEVLITAIFQGKPTVYSSVFLSGSHWYSDVTRVYIDEIATVTAWMSLPEPYAFLDILKGGA